MRRIVPILLAALALSGCVTSLHRHTAEGERIDVPEELYGTWRQDEGPDAGSTDPITRRLERGRMVAVYKDSECDDPADWGFFRVDGRLYLEYGMLDEDSRKARKRGTTPPGGELTGYYTVYAVELDGERLTLRPLEPEWLGKACEAGRFPGLAFLGKDEYDCEGYDGSPEVWKAVIRAATAEPSAWEKAALTFVRTKPAPTPPAPSPSRLTSEPGAEP